MEPTLNIDNGLPDDVNHLLHVWKTNIDNNEKSHRKYAIRYRTIYFALGVPATVLSGLTTTGAIAGLPECWDSGFLPLCVTTVILNVIVTILVGIQTFLQLMNRFFNHKLASDRYQALSRSVDIILSTKNRVEDAGQIINNIRSTFDDIVSTSPILSSEQKQLQFSIFNRTTRNATTPIVTPPDQQKLPPASKDELEKINKSNEEVCIDIPVPRNPTHDLLFQYQLGRFLNN